MKKFYIVFLLLFINICIINNTVNVKADAPEGYDKTYYVKINIAFGVINVYEKDNSGNYSKIAIALPCSLPDNIEEYKDTTAIIRAKPQGLMLRTAQRKRTRFLHVLLRFSLRTHLFSRLIS